MGMGTEFFWIMGLWERERGNVICAWIISTPKCLPRENDKETTASEIPLGIGRQSNLRSDDDGTLDRVGAIGVGRLVK